MAIYTFIFMHTPLIMWNKCSHMHICQYKHFSPSKSNIFLRTTTWIMERENNNIMCTLTRLQVACFFFYGWSFTIFSLVLSRYLLTSSLLSTSTTCYTAAMPCRPLLPDTGYCSGLNRTEVNIYSEQLNSDPRLFALYVVKQWHNHWYSSWTRVFLFVSSEVITFNICTVAHLCLARHSLEEPRDAHGHAATTLKISCKICLLTTFQNVS